MKGLVDGGMLSLLDIDQRLHKPIGDYFEALSVAPVHCRKAGSESKKENLGTNGNTSAGEQCGDLRRNMENEIEGFSGNKRNNGANGNFPTNESAHASMNIHKVLCSELYATFCRKHIGNYFLADGEKAKDKLCVLWVIIGVNNSSAETFSRRNALDMKVLLNCSHAACAKCLHDAVIKATEEKKGLPIK